MITKRQILNRVLTRSALNCEMSDLTTKQQEMVLDELETTMLSLSGHRNYKLGYIKAADLDDIDPGDDSGLRDIDLQYVVDLMIPKALDLFQLAPTDKQISAAHQALVYLQPQLPDMSQPKQRMPLGQGNRRGRIYAPTYASGKDENEITLIKGDTLTFE